MKFLLASAAFFLGLWSILVSANNNQQLTTKIIYSPQQLQQLKSGGNTTTAKTGANAFSLPATNLPLSKRLDFSVGNSFFVILGFKLLQQRMLVMD